MTSGQKSPCRIFLQWKGTHTPLSLVAWAACLVEWSKQLYSKPGSQLYASRALRFAKAPGNTPHARTMNRSVEWSNRNQFSSVIRDHSSFSAIYSSNKHNQRCMKMSGDNVNYSDRMAAFQTEESPNQMDIVLGKRTVGRATEDGRAREVDTGSWRQFIYFMTKYGRNSACYSTEHPF